MLSAAWLVVFGREAVEWPRCIVLDCFAYVHAAYGVWVPGMQDVGAACDSMIVLWQERH